MRRSEGRECVRGKAKVIETAILIVHVSNELSVSAICATPPEMDLKNMRFRTFVFFFLVFPVKFIIFLLISTCSS